MAAVALGLLLSSPVVVTAQETLASAAPDLRPRPGWTFTPGLVFSEVHDDNVTLFGRDSAAEQNNDYISSYRPQGDLRYVGRHTRFSAGYGATFLDYRAFNLLDRWDQRGQVDLRRVENARLEWFAHTSAARRPSTDLIEFGGIPFSRTGNTSVEARGGIGVTLSARNSFTTAVEHQRVEFDRPGELRAFLQGGNATASNTAFRHRVNSRTSLGADYIYRRAAIADGVEQSNTQTAQGSLERQLSDSWTLSGGAGLVHLAATPVSASQVSPALRASIDQRVPGHTFHVGYSRTLLPSFGYGGTVRSQEIGVSYFAPLFHSRRFYTDHSAVFRDNVPVLLSPGRLNLRSLRTNSAVGFMPQPWVRMEAFYTLVTQTSLLAGGRLDRHRVGFQIVTSKPLRIQ